ncbi:hypothetical protein HZ992_18815 [Rhizobacter sp. AJA081-3]|uniref:hypothetical protein n=1 Tax=Rhizobacter sp. AJA081-3 TaxID=2753607 RepID=UPI001ADF71CE|nr:hypothetical protein [Rhizobacter sp. AJA081-3]QTN22193.1 hypothetical protein HZ992_18815 [Rhizobacter sp. AJA081-3]
MNENTLNQMNAYIAGSLDEAGRRDLENRMSQDEQLRSQFEYLKLVAKGLQDYIPTPDPNVGVERALRRIHAKSAEAPGPSLVDRVIGLIPQWLREPRGLVFASVAVIATQFALIGHLVLDRGEDYSNVRATATRPAPPGPFIKVSFRTDTTEKDMRFLVVGLGATIVGGPTQLGDYYLFLEPGKTDWAAQQLRHSQFVDAVTVIAALPAVKE